MAFVIDRSLYLSPEVVVEPGPKGPLKEVDPFSLEALVAWLEKQPSEMKYDYLRPDLCLLGQYVSAQGGSYTPGWYIMQGRKVGTTSGLGMPDALYFTAVLGEATFGAALSRAHKLLAEREK